MLVPGRVDASPDYLAWIGRHDADLFVSTVSIVEIRQGIAKLERLGSVQRAKTLLDWLETTIEVFHAHLLDVTVEVALAAGDLSDQAIAMGRHPGFADILIAATAKAHDLTLLTRNLRHFEPLGIAASGPLTDLPG